jgi:hypothetical protein
MMEDITTCGEEATATAVRRRSGCDGFPKQTKNLLAKSNSHQMRHASE